MNSYPRFSYFSSDFSEIRYVNIHIVPLSKCESFEIKVKNSEKGSLLYWWKATQRRPNIDGVNEITLRRVLWELWVYSSLVQSECKQLKHVVCSCVY